MFLKTYEPYSSNTMESDKVLQQNLKLERQVTRTERRKLSLRIVLLQTETLRHKQNDVMEIYEKLLRFMDKQMCTSKNQTT
jgi:hypothetical protein